MHETHEVARQPWRTACIAQRAGHVHIVGDVANPALAFADGTRSLLAHATISALGFASTSLRISPAPLNRHVPREPHSVEPRIEVTA